MKGDPMTKKPKTWYSFKGKKLEENGLGFYESKSFEWSTFLESNWQIIDREIAEYLERNEAEIKPYFNNSLVTKKNSWKTSAFFFWNWKIRKNMKQCPETMAIMRQIPGITSVSISILEPGVTIKPHHGDTNAIIRGHLGLKIPEGLPGCGFQVNEEKRAWTEGGLLLFNDSAKHSAWNHTNKRRYVLLFDVIRPEFLSKKYRISSLILSSLLMQATVQKLPFLKKLPVIFLGVMLYINAFWINVILRVRN